MRLKRWKNCQEDFYQNLEMQLAVRHHRILSSLKSSTEQTHFFKETFDEYRIDKGNAPDSFIIERIVIEIQPSFEHSRSGANIGEYLHGHHGIRESGT